MKRPSPISPIDSTVLRRLDALERLIDAEYDGSPAVFESRTGIKMAQLNQWFTGYRALRDKALRRIEEKTGKPEGWFDSVAAGGNFASGGQELAIPPSARGGGSLRAAIDALALALVAIDPVDRAAAKAYLAGLCDAPDRVDLRERICTALEPPPSHRVIPETGAKSASHDRRRHDRRQNGPHREAVQELRVV